MKSITRLLTMLLIFNYGIGVCHAQDLKSFNLKDFKVDYPKDYILESDVQYIDGAILVYLFISGISNGVLESCSITYTHGQNPYVEALATYENLKEYSLEMLNNIILQNGEQNVKHGVFTKTTINQNTAAKVEFSCKIHDGYLYGSISSYVEDSHLVSLIKMAQKRENIETGNLKLIESSISF